MKHKRRNKSAPLRERYERSFSGYRRATAVCVGSIGLAVLLLIISGIYYLITADSRTMAGIGEPVGALMVVAALSATYRFLVRPQGDSLATSRRDKAKLARLKREFSDSAKKAAVGIGKMVAKHPGIQTHIEEQLTKLFRARKERREAEAAYYSTSPGTKTERERKRMELEVEVQQNLEAEEVAAELRRTKDAEYKKNPTMKKKARMVIDSWVERHVK